MSDTLLIHYNIEDNGQASWALCNDSGELTSKVSCGPLDDLKELTNSHTPIVLLNSQCLHISPLQLPTQNMQKMLKAVPYAIEEFIAEDIENFHFVISKNKHNDSTAVVGIDKATLQKIIDDFQRSDIVIEKIIPDALCLAANDAQWVYLDYLDNTYLQTDTLNGMTLSHDIAPYIVTSKLQDENEKLPEKILFFSEQEDTPNFDEVSSNELIEENDIELINIVYNTHPLVVFCGNYKQALPLNLLQHEFKTKRKTSGYWYQWRYAASLALIWLILHLGLSSFQYSKIAGENVVTNAEIINLYKKSFPDSKNLSTPRVRMERKLKALRNNSSGGDKGLVFLLAESFGTRTYDKANITLQSLTFRNDKMDIGLESKNFAGYRNFKQKP